MWTVILTSHLPGVRATSFTFHSYQEAEEFQSCIALRFPDAITTLEGAGDPKEVFPGWSF